jgi:hypothetical protein
MRCRSSGNRTLPATVVHGDPRNAQLPRLIGDLAGCMESGFVAGGLTSSRREIVQIADGVSKGGLSGVLFSDDVVVSTRLTQGCSPIGPRHTITGCQQNILISLDGRAALDVFREDVGEPAWKISQTGANVFAGLPVEDPIPAIIWFAIWSASIPCKNLWPSYVPRTDSQIMFCRRDEPSAAEDMSRMLDSIKAGCLAARAEVVLFVRRTRAEPVQR